MTGEGREVKGNTREARGKKRECRRATGERKVYSGLTGLMNEESQEESDRDR